MKYITPHTGDFRLFLMNSVVKVKKPKIFTSSQEMSVGGKDCSSLLKIFVSCHQIIQIVKQINPCDL